MNTFQKYEYVGSIASNDRQTLKNLKSGFYKYLLFGAPTMMGEVICRITSNGTVNITNPPSQVRFVTDTNFIQIYNDSDSNTLTVYRMALSSY